MLAALIELDQRRRVVDVAKSWLRTPFHHEACVKGVGVDCAMLLKAVYLEAGQIPEVAPEHYPHDWHLHRSEEKYLPWIERFANRIEGPPQAGDVAIFHIGRTWSHAGIVLEWPLIIHAWFSTSVEYCDATLEPLRSYDVRFYALREWKR